MGRGTPGGQLSWPSPSRC